MKGGHLALVCANPPAGLAALSKGQPIPDEAGWMGVVTLEDVLETLLQEHIYDEFDNAKLTTARARNLAKSVWCVMIVAGIS